jgi:hypothetical protein
MTAIQRRRRARARADGRALAAAGNRPDDSAYRRGAACYLRRLLALRSAFLLMLCVVISTIRPLMFTDCSGGSTRTSGKFARFLGVTNLTTASAPR